jgi:hypothetical protein
LDDRIGDFWAALMPGNLSETNNDIKGEPKLRKKDWSDCMAAGL